MRYHSLTALAVLALAHRSLGLPDGVGGHHGHHTEHAAAAAPASSYQEPVAAYEPAADPGYAVPDTGYGTPDYDTGYGYQGYDAAPQEGYEVAEAENGMSMIIVPLLIAAALFLLFPSVREVAVRKKREAGELEKHYRYITVYITLSHIITYIITMQTDKYQTKQILTHIAPPLWTRRRV